MFRLIMFENSSWQTGVNIKNLIVVGIINGIQQFSSFVKSGYLELFSLYFDKTN
jgi:hypothetical protein